MKYIHSVIALKPLIQIILLHKCQLHGRGKVKGEREKENLRPFPLPLFPFPYFCKKSIPLHKCQLTYSGRLKIKGEREPEVSYGLTERGQDLIVVLDQIEALAHKWYAQEQGSLETA